MGLNLEQIKKDIEKFKNGVDVSQMTDSEVKELEDYANSIAIAEAEEEEINSGLQPVEPKIIEPIQKVEEKIEEPKPIEDKVVEPVQKVEEKIEESEPIEEETKSEPQEEYSEPVFTYAQWFSYFYNNTNSTKLIELGLEKLKNEKTILRQSLGLD